ncbi:MAG: hypothetical protein C4526_05465 [Nitrospiraceae bacterium]|nr:MAG: hypothetical protein C4526_05465 [Nitrospiraceae bacterium]
MELTIEHIGTVGIFNFSGELTREHEDNLKIALMRAIHSLDRAVLNFKKVKLIDLRCMQLLKQAYLTSVRLRNPLIMINLQENHMMKGPGSESADFALEVDYERSGVSKEAVCS